MENKSKFIIIALAGAAVIFIFLYMQTLNSKQLMLKERDKLIADNAALTQQAQESQRKTRELNLQFASLNSDLDRLNKERSELQSRLDLLSKEKEDLIEKLKAKPQVVQVKEEAKSAPPAAPLGADAYWAQVLKAKTDLEFQLSALRNELRTTQINNEQLQKEKGSLGLDIKGLIRDKEDLRRQLEYNQKLMDSIAQEVVREKNDKAQILDSLKLLKNENIILRRQLSSLNNRKISLERKFQGLQEEKATLQRRFTEIQTMLSDKDSQINSLKGQLEDIRAGAKIVEPPSGSKESIELPPIVVRPQGQESASSEITVPLEGKVVAINKENNFIVVDLGEDAGLKVGDTFQAYREQEPIAVVEVIQVRRSISACDIKQESLPIEIGDVVR